MLELADTVWKWKWGSVKPQQIYQADDDDKDVVAMMMMLIIHILTGRGLCSIHKSTKSTESARRQTELCFFSNPPLSDKCSVYSGDEDFERKKTK